MVRMECVEEQSKHKRMLDDGSDDHMQPSGQANMTMIKDSKMIPVTLDS